MFRAQVREIAQSRLVLIEQAIGTALDHALRRKLVNVLPHAPEVKTKTIARDQHRTKCLVALGTVAAFGIKADSECCGRLSVIAGILRTPFCTKRAPLCQGRSTDPKRFQ